ncbi:MAG: 6-O-methylguanine DNA methyltransferase, partial [Leisingera sp.]
MNIEARENTYHYGVMRRAIELIDDGGEDLSLDQLAARMDMSP